MKVSEDFIRGLAYAAKLARLTAKRSRSADPAISLGHSQIVETLEDALKKKRSIYKQEIQETE